jgi:hypothetical protein
MKPINKALRLARKIPNGKATAEKRKAVKAWVNAIRVMLNQG